MRHALVSMALCLFLHRDAFLYAENVSVIPQVAFIDSQIEQLGLTQISSSRSSYGSRMVPTCLPRPHRKNSIR